MRTWNQIPLFRDNLTLSIRNGALVAFVISMVGIFVMFSGNAMLWYWWLIAFVCVAVFFFGTFSFVQKWRRYSPQKFEKELLKGAYWVRFIAVFISYGLFKLLTDDQLDFEPADVEWYDETAALIADLFYAGNWNIWEDLKTVVGGANRIDFADSGYPLYLGVVYILVGKSVLLARLVQSLWSAYTCVFIYRIAQRHFDEPTARLAGIMCMFMPSMFIYAGLHLKETVMVFLFTWFVERADDLMLNRRFSFKTVAGVSLIGLSLFMFRTVLGSVAFLAFAMALVFSSTKIIKGAKRTILIVLSVLFVLVAFTGSIKEEVEEVWRTDALAQQQVSMQHRYGSGKGGGLGNKLVDRVGYAVFAPLIFTLPFPTMVQTEGQDQKRFLAGGCFVKNVMSGFTIFAMFLMLFGGDIRSLDAEWRKHVLPIAALLGYLAVLALSQFAHSERFHQPALPLLMMFAAYGVTHLKPRQMFLWNLWQIAIVVICLGWAYIKLAGRGMA